MHAQVLDPSIINTAGGKIDIASTTNQANNNWMFDWSLGEPFAIQNWCSKNKIVFSIGFLQPSLLLNPELIRPGAFDFKLKWGPNPVSNYLLLSCKQAGIDIIRRSRLFKTYIIRFGKYGYLLYKHPLYCG
jgi:hypothetical protein